MASHLQDPVEGSLFDTARWRANRTDRLVRVSLGYQGGAQAPCVGPEAGRSPALGGCHSEAVAFQLVEAGNMAVTTSGGRPPSTNGASRCIVHRWVHYRRRSTRRSSRSPTPS